MVAALVVTALKLAFNALSDEQGSHPGNLSVSVHHAGFDAGLANYSLSKRPSVAHVITVTSWWARWRLKSPASRLFTQPFIQAQIKENIKDPRHWPLWGGIHRSRGNVSIWWRHHLRLYPSHGWFKLMACRIFCAKPLSLPVKSEHHTLMFSSIFSSKIRY